MNPIRISKLDHVVLRVADIDKSIHFYRDILGCPEKRRKEADGLYQYQAGASMIDLVPLDGELGRMGGSGPGSEGRNLDHFCLRIDPFDPDAVQAHLQAHGISFSEVARRYGAEGMGPSIYIEDPDGNTVELKGPPEA